MLGGFAHLYDTDPDRAGFQKTALYFIRYLGRKIVFLVENGFAGHDTAFPDLVVLPNADGEYLVFFPVQCAVVVKEHDRVLFKAGQVDSGRKYPETVTVQFFVCPDEFFCHCFYKKTGLGKAATHPV